MNWWLIRQPLFAPNSDAPSGKPPLVGEPKVKAAAETEPSSGPPIVEPKKRAPFAIGQPPLAGDEEAEFEAMGAEQEQDDADTDAGPLELADDEIQGETDDAPPEDDADAEESKSSEELIAELTDADFQPATPQNTQQSADPAVIAYLQRLEERNAALESKLDQFSKSIDSIKPTPKPLPLVEGIDDSELDPAIRQVLIEARQTREENAKLREEVGGVKREFGQFQSSITATQEQAAREAQWKAAHEAAEPIIRNTVLAVPVFKHERLEKLKPFVDTITETMMTMWEAGKVGNHNALNIAAALADKLRPAMQAVLSAPSSPASKANAAIERAKAAKKANTKPASSINPKPGKLADKPFRGNDPYRFSKKFSQQRREMEAAKNRAKR